VKLCEVSKDVVLVLMYSRTVPDFFVRCLKFHLQNQSRHALH